MATSTWNRSRGRPLGEHHHLLFRTRAVKCRDQLQDFEHVQSRSPQKNGYLSSPVFQDIFKQFHVTACDMLDRKLLIDAASRCAAHVEGPVEIVPLIDDHAGEGLGIVGGCQPAVLEVADKRGGFRVSTKRPAGRPVPSPRAVRCSCLPRAKAERTDRRPGVPRRGRRLRRASRPPGLARVTCRPP